MCILYVCVYWYTWIYVYIYAWMYVYIDIHECMGIYIHVINSSIMTITTLLYSHGSYPLFMHVNILISSHWWYGVVFASVVHSWIILTIVVNINHYWYLLNTTDQWSVNNLLLRSLLHWSTIYCQYMSIIYILTTMVNINYY